MSQQRLDVADAAAAIAATLNEKQVEYAIGGALALGFWTEPRGTIDVDITLYLPLDAPHETVLLLIDIGCEFSHREVVEQLREHGYCRVLFRGIVVDVFLPTIPFYELAKDRRQRTELAGVTVSVWKPEVLCVFKLMFMRPQDFVDVEKLMEAQHQTLDTDWVRGQLIDIFGKRDPRISNWDEIVARTRG